MDAILFPGQGSQAAGMREQVERWRPELVLLARAAVGDDPFERADEGTRFAQPAIFCAALAGWRSLRDDFEPGLMAGHSLGEISALVAAGAMDAEDGLNLVAARGSLMQEAADAAGGGGMLAVRATDRDELADVTADTGVILANDNSPEQVVLSGPDDALERAERELRERGVRAKRLPVAGAFHSPAMESAVPEFRERLGEIDLRAPSVPVLSCVTAEPFDDVRERLAQALTRPVRWLDVMRELRARGATRFVETGPGKVLTGLVRRSLDGVDADAPAMEAAHA
ncbi:MAG TPA: acyltransferase domain-containing protein [Thermoleophilaceae bacterium]